MNDNQFRFQKLKTNVLKLKKELPVELANHAQNFFTGTFTKQGWDGIGWRQVNRRIPGTPEYKYPKSKGLSRRTKPILVGSGALRRAVSNSIRSKTFEDIRLIVDLPYAAAQNEGNDKIPKRKYMGDSPVLRKEQKAKIKKFMDNLWA